MPLEPSVTDIDDLNPAWPLAADPKSEGDDHLRELKKVLANDFAGYTGAVVVTGTDGGAANAYTVTPTTAQQLPAYGLRMGVVFSPTVANTGASTLNISSLGAKALRAVDGTDLVTGDLTVGTVYAAYYNGTEFRLTCPTKNYIDLVRAYATQLSLGQTFPASAADATKFLQYTGSGYQYAYPQTMPRSTRTSNTALAQSDRATLVDVTSGTFTQTFTAAATLGAGWYCLLRNAGTGDITLDPNGAELIDGLTSYVMYPGEARMIQCDGIGFTSVVLRPFSKTFTSSGNFPKPPGYTYFEGQAWSAGQGGARSGATGTTAMGGNAGGCFPFSIPASAMAASEVVTIGSGGASLTGVNANGNAGGNTSLGSFFTVFGASASGGGAIGITNALVGANGAQPVGFEAGSGNSSTGTSAIYGGGSSSNNAAANSGSSIYGGGAGGGIDSTNVLRAPGTSKFGGNGGAAATTTSGADGVAPGGGGGATQTGTQSGAGARGELRIWGKV